MTRIENEWRYFDDKLGIPYPWYTKPCLEFLESIELINNRIFEYGTGDSTKWFRAKHALVWGVDNDPNYVSYDIRFKNFFPEYCSAILEHHLPFDIVVIDGEWRDECTEYALNALKPGGLLIIDNYKQPSVPFIWTKTEKLIEGMDIKIYKEPDHADWVTAVITKP